MGRVSLKTLTTFRVGGFASKFVRAPSQEGFIDLIQETDAHAEPLTILGEGSNVLAPDEGIDHLVVAAGFSSLRFEEFSDHVIAIAEAGVSWDELVRESVVRGLWGLENLSGIPGTVGAAPVQNIGAYGSELSDTLERVTMYDRRERSVRTLMPRDMRFGYRASALKKERDRFAILDVSLRLSKTPHPNIAYAGLAERFSRDAIPSLVSIREAVLSIRKGKFPDRASFGTAGSFFLNPTVSRSVALALSSQYPELPQFKTAHGVKLSLAWVLDHILNAKDMRIGGAFVWREQPLVIVTDESATAADVCALAERLQQNVFKRTRIRIVPEVTFL